MSIVIAFGALETVRWLPHRTLKAAAVVGLVIGAAIDVHASWGAVRRDTRILDAQRFVRTYSTLSDARLFVDAPSIEVNGRLRTWNRFYLEGAPDMTWFDEPQVAVDVNSAECVFVATGDVERYRRQSDVPWWTIMKFRKFDRLAGDIWIVGTCALEVPWALGGDLPLGSDDSRP